MRLQKTRGGNGDIWETFGSSIMLLSYLVFIEMGDNSCYLYNLLLLRLRWETTPVFFFIYYVSPSNEGRHIVLV
jgi:hypothetical protein